MNDISLLTRARIHQIRILAKVLDKISSHHQVARLLTMLGRSAFVERTLFGYRRVFLNFAEADRHARKYHIPSHEHPGNVDIHVHRTESVRSSDYPLLFHLQRIFSAAKGSANSVLDIGGSIGNLFYCYSRYLDYPPSFKWTVCEVELTAKAGQKLAMEKNEARLQFVDNVKLCTAADIVIISGALHYFDSLPPEMIGHFARPPMHVFINRTPVIDGPTAITLQDHEQYIAMSPARILSRRVLIDCMAAAKYDLVDHWSAPELSLKIPLHPEASVSSYSGFYFRSQNIEAWPPQGDSSIVASP